MAGSVNDERYRSLIQVLRNTRLATGLSQADLAKSVGQRQQFVAKYESGERRLDVVEFMDVARRLGIDWRAILAEIEPRN